MKNSLLVRASAILTTLSAFTLLSLLAAGSCMGQSGQVFRLDGGDSTYVFGVNERGELQPLYWGGRLGAHDSVPTAHSLPEVASFDSPYTTTPQEYAGWGAGLFTEPALKVTFADGNRDLVLHFVSGKPDGPGAFDVLLKDISREIYVTLRYSIDAESGILARSAEIENREKAAGGDRAGRRRAMDAASGALHAELSDRPLGWRVDAESGTNPGRSARDRKPPRNDRPSGESVVCDFAR